MFGLFRKKRRGDGRADQRAPVPPLSPEMKAQRDREFAERLQERLNAQTGQLDGGEIEPKFKSAQKENRQESRPAQNAPAAPIKAAPPPDSRREDARPAAAPRPEVKGVNGTARPSHSPATAAAPHPTPPTAEREAKPPQPIPSLPLVMRAAQFAADRHKAQRRKGAAREPYVNHVLEVAALLAEASDGRDPDLVVAGLLHDLVEEQGVSADELAAQFGVGVAALVLELTDDKTLPAAERRRLQIVNSPHKSPRPPMLKIAHTAPNPPTLRQHPPPNLPP